VTVLPEKIVHIGGKFFTDRDDLYKIKDKKIRRKNGTSTPLQ
jgi:hypothetical protein